MAAQTRACGLCLLLLESLQDKFEVSSLQGEYFPLTYLNKQPNDQLWSLCLLFWGITEDSDVAMRRS